MNVSVPGAGQERDTELLARRSMWWAAPRGESQPSQSAEAMIATNVMAFSIVAHGGLCRRRLSSDVEVAVKPRNKTMRQSAGRLRVRNSYTHFGQLLGDGGPRPVSSAARFLIR